MEWHALRDWPLSEWSRQVNGPVHRWHVQEHGEGPTVLFLHGAGGSTHSWRAVMQALSDQMRVIAIDLPGHGFTKLGARQRSGVSGMSADVAALMAQEHWQPDLIVAHSAGAAVALDLVHHHWGPDRPPPWIIGVNPALAPFNGVAGLIFPAVAKVLALTPFTASFFAASVTHKRVAALIDSTGSQLDPEGLMLYQKLTSDRDHVDGALRMMSQWDLSALLAALPQIEVPTTFVVGTQDKTVPSHVAHTVAARLPHADVIELDELGHLAHEEAPERIARIIMDIVERRRATN